MAYNHENFARHAVENINVETTNINGVTFSSVGARIFFNSDMAALN